MKPSTFQELVLSWFDQHGRKDLPWQKNITPYRVWISETMLQQTQVATVIPYFDRFMEKFPDMESLANASLDSVLQNWAGLGYYARARNLHKAARVMAQQGYFPSTLPELVELPGIGRSTAGAILSIAFNQSHPILDGNVKRVLSRFKAISGWLGTSEVNKELWALSMQLTPQNRIADYTQAIMDLGATLCTRRNPDCASCPLYAHCIARITHSVSDFPSPKPIKALTVKQVVLLLVRDLESRIFLEKRPPSGIWGGLWSVPEFDSVEAAKSWCETKQIRILTQQSLPKQRHSFSHFHLDYTPLLIKANNRINYVMEANDAVWYKMEEIEGLGLPAPIKLLLQQSPVRKE